MRRFNEIIDFDPEKKTLQLYAGITLGKLYNYLFPRGFYLPVQPGWYGITLGGIIAANSHGKNPYKDGMVIDWVESLELFHPLHGQLYLSRSENEDLFYLTCGGYGLTGIIISAKIRLAEHNWSVLKTKNIPVKDIFETYEMFKLHRDDYETVYSWNDYSRYSHKAGRGFVMLSKNYQSEKNNLQLIKQKVLNPHERKLRLKLFYKPFLPIINTIFYLLNTKLIKENQEDLNSVLFPWHNKLFYFDAYGNRGYLNHQVIIPEKNINVYFKRFHELQRSLGIRIVLTMSKLFRGKQILLHFNGNGIGFGFDLINCKESISFLNKLDNINTELGCITCPIKDSRLTAIVAKKQYKEYDLFRQKLNDFDPKRIFKSALSDRLEL